MRRASVLAVLLAAAGCGREPEPTAIQRGERAFRPAAEKLAESMVGELKKSDPAGLDRYLKEIGGKEPADLIRKISSEVLAHYADALSISAGKETDLKAGKYDDAMNLRKINSAIGTFTKSKLKVPQVCQALLAKYNAGEWKSGLELEFSARVLEGEILLPRD